MSPCGPVASRVLPAAALLAVLMAARPAGAAPADAKAGVGVKPSSTEIVFPLPPDEPRIRYLFGMRSVHDLNPPRQGFFRRALDFLLGRGDEEVPRLTRPFGVAASGSRVYAADADGGAVFVFDLAKKEVTRLGGTLEGRLISPIGVAATQGGTVFVADSIQNVVKAYAPDGTFLRQLNKQGELKRPTGVAWDRVGGRVLVADTLASCVVAFSPEGGIVGRIGEKGTGDGQMSMPVNLAVDSEGGLYVVDPILCRVQMFSNSGAYLGKFGEQGDVPGYLARPRGVGVDSDGNIYVADAILHIIQVFDRSGRLLLFFGTGGGGPAMFDGPAGICVDSLDRVFVADSQNGRIQAFQYLKKKLPEGG